MSAPARPILVFVAGFFLAGCAPSEKEEPALMHAPKFFSGETLLAQSEGTEAPVLGPGDFMELSLAQGSAPARADALQLQLKCLESGHDSVHTHVVFSPWKKRVYGRDLIPPSSLRPESAKALLECHLDFTLWDDFGNSNLQKGMSLHLKDLGKAGTFKLAGAEGEGPWLPEDFDSTLELTGVEPETTPELTIVCEDTGLSHLGAPANTLKKLMSLYFKEIDGVPSKHQVLRCRIFDSHGFSPVFQIARPHLPITVSVHMNTVRRAGEASFEIDIHLSNPNPFEVELLVSDGKILEDYVARVNLLGTHRIQQDISLGPQQPLWQHLPGSESIIYPAGPSGQLYRLAPHQEITLKSRNGVSNGYPCWGDFSTIKTRAVRPVAVLPVGIWLSGRLGALVPWPTDPYVVFSPPVFENAATVPLEKWPQRIIPRDTPPAGPGKCKFWH